MLLTISTTHPPATDIGYLLHKHPGRCVAFELSFGQVYVFYPEATPGRCTAALLLDVDPVRIVRGKPGSPGTGVLAQYVNDRAYVASSFLSVAIARVYGTALQGTCRERPELARTPIPLHAKIAVLPCRGGEALVHRLFEPLGYTVATAAHVLDETFPDWGESACYTVELDRVTTLRQLLTHLYVLVPVLDNAKHYYVGDEEVDKLLAKGADWLAGHPERDLIAKRYLKYRASLARQAIERLAEEDQAPPEADDDARHTAEAPLEEALSLGEQRTGAVLAALVASGAKRVVDLGCGEGRLLGELLKQKQFETIVGMDVSVGALEIAHERLHLDRLPERQRERMRLIHGSLMYRDQRLAGFDAGAVVEVVEHLDAARLAAFQRVVFEHAAPPTVVLTTPNREYNVMWEAIGPDRLRHPDHRFEWTRDEFRAWAGGVADRFGYRVRFVPVGPDDPRVGPPTQMAVFTRPAPRSQAEA